MGTRGRPLFLPRQSIPLPQPHPTSRPRARRRRQSGAHPGAPGQTANPPLPLSTAPSKRPSPPPKTTHPAPQGATTIPHQGRQMARQQAHPRPGRAHTLPVRPHHPGGLGTLQAMPPPYRQGHVQGQHEGWPTHSHAHQATEHLFRDPLVKQATMRGAVKQALHRHLTKHTESPMEAAAHLQLEAVRRAAAQMVHGKHLLLTHAEQLTDPIARESMQRLIHYHAVHDPDVHSPTPYPAHAPHLHPEASKTPPKRPKVHLSPKKPPSTVQPGRAQPGPTIRRRRRARPRQPIQPTPPGPGASPPHTGHPLTPSPRPQPPPSNPPRQGPDHPPGLVPPTGGLDQAHRQSPLKPDQPRQRPPRGHHGPRTLASPQTHPGPGPDT